MLGCMGAEQLILIVEDECDLSATLEFALAREGFATRTVREARSALELAVGEPRPDLVLLDVMLPDMSGLEVCRRLRSDERTRSLPIVMTTARADEIDRARGSELGADDFIVKPFSLRELVARCRAALRRRTATAATPARHGRLCIDTEGRRVWLDQQEVRLTALEFRLLTTLVDRRGRAQTRDALRAAAQDAQPGLTTRSIDAHVRRLREKLGDAVDSVQTLRGVGYLFHA
jgi:two-component system phosphate regulon response regulator PhoB